MKRALLAILLTAACGSTDGARTAIDGTAVTIGAATLQVPAGWQPTINAAANRQVFEPAENDRKESIAIRVVDRKGSENVDDLLDNALDAEGALADVKLGPQHRVTTQDGVQGIWIDLTFTPGSIDATYARTQLTLVTDKHVINILYTALKPDTAHRAIELALATLHEEA